MPKPYPANHPVTGANLNDFTGVINRLTTVVDAVSSVGAFVLLDSVTIAAGAMSTDRIVRATIIGDYLNNTGINSTFTLFIRLGGGAYQIEDVSNTIATNATRRAFKIVAEVANLGATNSQLISVHVHMSGIGATAGLGDLASPTTEVIDNLLNATATIDTTAAQIFQVTVVNSANSANLSFRKKYAVVELL